MGPDIAMSREALLEFHYYCLSVDYYSQPRVAIKMCRVVHLITLGICRVHHQQEPRLATTTTVDYYFYWSSTTGGGAAGIDILLEKLLPLLWITTSTGVLLLGVLLELIYYWRC